MGRHFANYHQDLAQLWRCPASWCTQWEGSPQDCVDHPRQAHAVPSTVEAANLGKWFPPWTVSREIWREALKPNVSGVSMDILLFSGRGASLGHHYRMFGGGSVHISLRGSYMTKLRAFTMQAEAAGRWARHGESAAVCPGSVCPRDIRQRGTLISTSPGCPDCPCAFFCYVFATTSRAYLRWPPAYTASEYPGAGSS